MSYFGSQSRASRPEDPCPQLALIGNKELPPNSQGLGRKKEAFRLHGQRTREERGETESPRQESRNRITKENLTEIKLEMKNSRCQTKTSEISCDTYS